MGSTLRSLVLAYKADTKDFRKGSESVKAEIRSVKDHVSAMDRQMGRSFGNTGQLSRMTQGVRQLSQAFQQGSSGLRSYTSSIDNLLTKVGPAAALSFAAYKGLQHTYDSASEMAKEGPGTTRGISGEIVRNSFHSVFGGIKKGLSRVGEVPVEMIADFANKASGGGITKAVEQQKETLRLEEAYAAIREKNRIRDERIAAAKERAAEATRREIAAEKAKRAAIEGSLDAMREEAAVGELMATGMSEAAARMKVAGGTSDDVKNAGFLAAKIQAQRDEAARKATRGEDFNAMLGTGVEDMFRQAAEQVKAVDAFGKQFDNPVERFKRKAEEIRKMREMGLSPEIMERAMKANAASFAGSQGGNFTGANVVSGSAESMKLAEQAKIGDRQEKGIEKLVKIQEEALKNAKDNAPLEINVTNVSI